MILQLLGVIGLTGLTGLSTSHNSVTGFRDYSNDYNYQVRFTVEKISDLVYTTQIPVNDGTSQVVECYYGGLDYNYQGDFIIQNGGGDTGQDRSSFDTFSWFRYDTEGYITSTRDVDLFIYTQFYKTQVGVSYQYEFSINFAFGKSYHGSTNNITLHGLNTNVVESKSTFGFPYNLNDVYNSAENEDSPNEWAQVHCEDQFSPYNLALGYDDSWTTQQQLYPYPYGYHLSFTSISNYTSANLDSVIGALNIYVETYNTDDDNQSMYNLGFNQGYSKGESAGYQHGYNDGLLEADHQSAVASSIFIGIIDIALVPINFFLACLNFEVFGINIGSFVTALMTIMIIIVIARVIFNGGNKK